MCSVFRKSVQTPYRRATVAVLLLLSLGMWRAPFAGADGLPCCAGGKTFIPYRPAPGEPPDVSTQHRLLRIFADPNNLPFTNDRLEGFENRIAELVAHEMKADILYIWRAQRRGFFREGLKDGNCDLIMGAPVHYERALTTNPYYTSTYCFVSRKNGGPSITSLDDPALRDLKIGVQIVGDDGVNTPPAHALAARGIVGNIVGFTVYGDYAQPNPPARVVDAVARGDVDVAVVWGPLAGYFARREPVKMEVVPITPAVDRTGLPFVFSIGMGVRKDDTELRDQLNGIIDQYRDRIDRILDEYGIPRAAPLPTRGETGNE